jgi:hypothetical protein
MTRNDSVCSHDAMFMRMVGAGSIAKCTVAAITEKELRNTGDSRDFPKIQIAFVPSVCFQIGHRSQPIRMILT